jgi:hypothetical protein
MKIAIMQPYAFPYIGYFQLIKAVDLFVFYDDVNYPKKGWVNRNRILQNGEESLITIPLIKASQNKLIKDLEMDPSYLKLLRNIEFNYKNSTQFSKVFPLVENIFRSDFTKISDFAIESICEVCNYLDIKQEFVRSSHLFGHTSDLPRADRLIEISRLAKADTYINSVGGQKLYDKDYFDRHAISLKFLKSIHTEYQQFGLNDFIPWLSIIDVLMFNEKKVVLDMIDRYELI